jgi:hypothetical protein
MKRCSKCPWPLCLVLTACGAQPETETAAGAHLDLIVPTEYEICGGTLASYDAMLETMSERWGVSLDDWRGTVRFDPTKALPQNCSIDEGGCAIGDQAWVTTPEVVEHELVHMLDGGRPPAFFAEGLAVYWGSTPYGYFSEDIARAGELPYATSSTDLLSRAGQAYWVAGGAIGRLLETHGPDTMRGFFEATPRDASPEQIDASFAANFGEELQPFLADYAQSDEIYNRPLWFCEGADAIELPFNTTLECSDPLARGFSRRSDSRELPRRMALRFELEGTTRLSVLHLGVEALFLSCDPSEYGHGIFGNFSDMPVADEFTLAAGVWHVLVTTNGDDDPAFGIAEVG